MFGRNKEGKRAARAAMLGAVVEARHQQKAMQPFGSQGISYGGEGDPGFGMGGQTSFQVVGNASPEQMATALARVQEFLGQMGAQGGLPAGTGLLSNPDTVAQLQHLAARHTQGELTNEEFAAQARQLMSGQ